MSKKTPSRGGKKGKKAASLTPSLDSPEMEGSEVENKTETNVSESEW